MASRLRSSVIYLAPMAWVLAANLPGRWRMAVDLRSFGVPTWESFVGGLIADLAIIALPLVMVLAPAIYIAMQYKRARLLVIASASVLFGALWLLSVSAAETHQQLGYFPTFREAVSAFGSRAFAGSSLPITVGPRYLALTIVGVIVFALTLVAWVRRLDREFSLRRQVAITVAVALPMAVIVAIAPRVFSHVGHPRELYPPAVTFVRSLVPIAKTSQFSGLRAVFIAREVSMENAARGAVLLNVAAAGAGAPAPPPALVPAGAPIVFHVIVESLRGDDVFALNHAAPPTLLPTLDALYQHRRTGTSIAFTNVYQSGIRTAQALGAALCGIGVLPFNASVVRDFGRVPLRCIPEVLSDAHFATQIDYAGELSFDNMLDFFRAHGMQTIEAKDFPSTTARGTWSSISDQPLYADALERARRAPKDVAQYNVILTLANHVPFDPPTDLPSVIGSRVEQLARAFSDSDRRRLVTMAYSDWALGQFLDALDHDAELAPRSIVILHADHATAETFLWSAPSLRSFANVPLVIYAPTPHANVAALAVLADHPLSIAAVPSLIAAIAGAPSALPGCAELTGAPFLSIDANARVLSVDANGPSLNGETNPPFATPDDFATLGPRLGAIGDYWSDTLRRSAHSPSLINSADK